MMRRANLALMIAGLLLIAACGADQDRLIFRDGSGNADTTEAGEEGAGDALADAHDHAHGDAHGEVYDFTFDTSDDSDRADFEAGADMQTQVVTPERAFRGVKVMVTAPKLDLEYRLVLANGQTTDWIRFSSEQSNGKFHNGHLGLRQFAEQFHFRSTSPLEYARFEFFEHAVETPDVHDDIMVEQEEGTRSQALAHSGRYTPPAEVRAAGQAQQGNFSYQSAPAWNGGANCSGTFLPGAKALGDFLVANFEGAVYYQGYNCRQVRGSSSMSMHGTGRAIDVFVPRDETQSWANQADNDLGDPIANYLIENATELGVQFFIWDRAKWNIRYAEDRSYGGSHPHHDHLHIELTVDAAQGTSGQFPGAAASYEPHFSDDDGSEHEEAINAMYEEGITRGCEGGSEPKFCPEKAETRANLATMVTRAFDLPRTDEDYFDDDDDSRAEEALNAVAARGAMIGCGESSDRRFCPADKVTRGEFALVIDRLLDLADTASDYYGDDAGAIYEAAANRLTAAGIITGCAEGRFCGDDAILRGELAGSLMRALGQIAAYAVPEPAKEIEFVLRWRSEQVDLDLRMAAPDEVDYQDDTATDKGWVHGGDECPEAIGGTCTGQATDGYFSESIWLADSSQRPDGSTAFALEVETFDGDGGSFDLLIYEDGEAVGAYQGQVAPAQGDTAVFEFSLP